LPIERLRAAIEDLQSVEYKYISLVDEFAYCEQFDYNDDESDVSRGTHVYSLGYFFEQFFGLEECYAFKEFASRFTIDVKNYLGYTVAKNLIPNALFSFKKVVETSLRNYPFAQKVARENSEDGITEEQIAVIEQQFFDKNYYKVVIGKMDFAESFITAEWLYDTMKTTGKIDLTAVAMGYFKAIEQLLYNLIILHTNEKRTIQKLNSRKNRKFPWKIELNDDNINNGRVDKMLNSLIGFLHDNKDLFRSEIGEKTRDYIIKELNKIKTLRNGYFHKDNLHEWEKVDEARLNTYVVFYLVFGAYEFSTQDMIKLNIPAVSQETDYDKLCKYMNYNNQEIYYVGSNTSIFYSAVGQPDRYIEYDEYGDAKYSGAYVNKLIGVKAEKVILDIEDISALQKEVLKLDPEDQHLTIYEGNMTPCPRGMEFSGPVKVIFDKGKFVGNGIEEDIKY
jgi:hypothetical protein